MTIDTIPRLRARYPINRVSIPTRVKRLFSSQKVTLALGPHAFMLMCTGDLYPGIK
jgi:hypothetical protein